MFKQCQQGKLDELKDQISQLTKRKSTGRVKATAVKSPEEEEDDESDYDAPEVCFNHTRKFPAIGHKFNSFVHT